MKKISSLLKNLQELKENYSIKDKKDIFKLKPKLKGKYFIKHIDDMITMVVFSNNYIVPSELMQKNQIVCGGSDSRDKDSGLEIIQKEDLRELIPDGNFMIQKK